MIDERVINEHFPHRPTGYLDTAAVGPVPAAVGRALSQTAEALAWGVRGSTAWHQLSDETIPLLSEELGLDPERTTVVANTSSAFSSAVLALDLPHGSEVLTFADDFPTVLCPWTASPWAAVVELPKPEEEDRTASLLHAISAKTRVVAVSEVHSTTGTLIDLAAVGAACRDVGAFLLVDAAQSAGLVRGSARWCDVYAAPSYKWLLAGFGSAVVGTSSRFDQQARPQLLGYRNAPPSPRLNVGHDNVYGLAALQAATRVRRSLGLDSITEHTRFLAARLRSGADEMGVRVASDHGGAGIVSLVVADAAELQTRLASAGISVANRGGYLRVSPSLTTTLTDVDRFLEELDKVTNSNYPAPSKLARE